MKNTLIRAATGLVLVSAIVILVTNSAISFGALLLVINFWATYEYGSINKYNSVLQAILSSGVYVLMFVNFSWALYYAFACICITAILYYFQNNQTKEKWISVLIKLVPWAYITLVLALLMVFSGFGSQHGFNPIKPLAVFVFLWISDTMQFVSGKLIGKHKLAPKISPKKTIEGFIGGLFFTVAIAAIFNHFNYFESNKHPLIYWAIIIVIFGSAGDLFESYIKRKNAVKDSGNILPGHGGFLDRFDGLLGAVPFLFLLDLFF